MVEYVYVDSDVSSLAKKFPIDVHDSEVSGIACWSHLQSQTGGALEHWAIAFMPHHPNITEAGVSVSRLVVYNLQHPEFLLRNDTKEAEAEDPWTMRLTGPAMYQYTLHRLCYRNRSVRRLAIHTVLHCIQSRSRQALQQYGYISYVLPQ